MGSSLWNALTRKKIEESSEETKLARVLNLFDLTALGVGSTLGLGVYVLAGSVAYNQAGPAVVISFLLAAIASTFAGELKKRDFLCIFQLKSSPSGLCYAEFAARVPKAGSAYVYSYVTVGEFVAFTIGWNLILEYVIGASSVARGLSGYIDFQVGGKMSEFWLKLVPMKVDFLAEYPDVLSFGIVMVLTAVLAAGVKESSYLHSVFTTINLCTIVMVVIAGSLRASTSNWSIDPANIKQECSDEEMGEIGEGGFMPFGIAGVMAGAAKCFYGFVGFDCVATAGEEAKNAKRNIPLAVLLTLAICVAVYISISTVLTMMVPYYCINSDSPLPHAFERIGWTAIKWIVSIAAIFALFSSLLGALYSLPRVCYAMGKDGVLFKFMGQVYEKTKTPIAATLLSGIFSAVMAAVFSLHQLVDMLSIGTLLAYTIVAICVLVLRYERDLTTVRSFNGGFWKQLFRMYSTKGPTWESSTVTKVCVIFFSVLATVLGCLLTFFPFSTTNIILISICAVSMLLTIFIIAVQPTDKSIRISFKVPLVPLLPCVSIFCNIYLMLQLDGATWIRFGVWLLIGKLSDFEEAAWS